MSEGDQVIGDDLLVRVAWLYHVGGESQEEVAKALGISRFKVNRILGEARERGIVRVSIEHASTETLAIADRLRAAFGLKEAIVTPRLDDGSPGTVSAKADDIARRAVGIAAAGLLARKLQGEDPITIGIGWGRTIAAMAGAVTGVRKRNVRFVSLMGTLTRTAATNPFDVVMRLATICGGEAYFLPAPFIVDREADLEVLLGQRIVQETLAVARAADVSFISVGECTESALLVESGIIGQDDLNRLRSARAVADTTGKFFTADGRLADTDLNRRTPCITLEDLANQEVVLLAGGQTKTEATRAVLSAGFVDRLVVDGDLALRLLSGDTGRAETEQVGEGRRPGDGFRGSGRSSEPV